MSAYLHVEGVQEFLTSSTINKGMANVLISSFTNLDNKPININTFHGLRSLRNKLGNLDCVATLTLGSRPKQGVARLWTKREVQKSCHMLSRVQESVKE